MAQGIRLSRACISPRNPWWVAGSLGLLLLLATACGGGTSFSASLTLNAGASYSNAIPAQASMTVTSSAGAVIQRQFSWDGRHFTAWEPYSSTRTVSLPAGDGPKTLTARFKDADGNLSPFYAAHITLDTSAPTGSLGIDDGEAATTDPEVILTLQASDLLSGVTQMQFSCDSQTWEPWEPFSSQKARTLQAGPCTVYARFQDGAGNISGVLSAHIAVVAWTGAVSLDGGASYCNNPSLEATTATLTASTGGGTTVSQMQLSWDGATFTAWEAFAATRNLAIPAGDGAKTLSVRFQDSLGNSSPVFTGGIILDTAAPTGSVVINGGAAATRDPRVTLGLQASDSLSGVAQMQFSSDGQTWTSWQAYGSAANLTLQPLAGRRSVFAHFKDRAGNIGSASSAITLEAPPPSANLFAQERVFHDATGLRASVPAQVGMAYQWTLTNGTASGQITSGADGNVLTYSSGAASGSYTLTVSVQNMAGETATASRTLQVVDHAFLKDVLAPDAHSMDFLISLQDGRFLLGSYPRPECYDPFSDTWAETGPMTQPRTYSLSAPLADGSVLSCAGWTREGSTPPFFGLGYFSKAERFNPLTNTWSSAGDMGDPRAFGSATLLLNGKVLVAGGMTQDLVYGGPPTAYNRADLYDPSSNTWSRTSDMNLARFGHSATLLPDGRVLVAGGLDGAINTLAEAEIFDAASNSWSNVASMAHPRSGAAALLPNGKVVVLGGSSPYDPASAEQFDPATGLWQAISSMTVARSSASCTLLQDGQLLVLGGGSAERYDSATDSWSSAGSLRSSSGHLAGLLPDGRVLAISAEGQEFYSPVTNSWSNDGSLAGATRAVRISKDEVLAVRGAQAARFKPSAGTWSAAGTPLMEAKDAYVTLQDGSVLFLGPTAQRYDPVANAWSLAGTPATGSQAHGAVTLSSGKVLALAANGQTELYDPATNAWTASVAMPTAACAAVILLQDGSVLAAGSSAGGVIQGYRYDPVAAAWSKAWELNGYYLWVGKDITNMQLLGTGRVLIILKNYDFVAMHEFHYFSVPILADLGTGSTTALEGNPPLGNSPSMSLMEDGELLMAGGYSQEEGSYWNRIINLIQAYVYDPVTNTSIQVGDMHTPGVHASVPLADGRVLFLGGGVVEFYKP